MKLSDFYCTADIVLFLTATAAVLYVLNYANQLETLAVQVNESIYNSELSLTVDGNDYYAITDSLSFVGDVGCQPGERILRFGCGKYVCLLY